MKTISELTITSQISATIPDWSREKCNGFWDPSRQLLKSIREYQKWQAYGGWIGRLFQHWNVLQHRFWSIVTGADIPINCKIEGGLLLIHPNGVVIHPQATIGPNCLILQQTTIVSGVKIGGHVDIGAGAKIIRPVTIGDHAKIGANAVVLCDVPAGATAVGVPAKIIMPATTIESLEAETIQNEIITIESLEAETIQNEIISCPLDSISNQVLSGEVGEGLTVLSVLKESTI